MTSRHIQHMHKALTQMNVPIHLAIGDLTGATGLAIVDAIIAAERNPAVLASPWWATGGQSICLRWRNRVRATDTTRSRLPRSAGRPGREAVASGPQARTGSYKLFGVYLTQIPGLMAMVLILFSEGHAKSASPYLRRMKSRLGPAGATTATAHQIAIIFYTMVKKQVECDGTQLGYKLAPIEEPAA